VKKKPPRRENSSSPPDREDARLGPSEVRIIGGNWRHRKIAYSGDVRTRPMKDRTREAIFNLITDRILGFCAVDLFAGTGALGLEALSRGAARAVFCERHFPTADLLRRNLAELGATEQAEVLACDTFLHVKRLRRDGATFDAGRPWVVFCSPPYAFYSERQAEMLAMLDDVITLAPTESLFVVEADEQFDFHLLPCGDGWRVRDYRPAAVGILQKNEEPSTKN
jgi:16S rRNA (guanine966-N2)-methyltransferase